MMIPFLAFIGFSLTIILPWILCATKRKFEPINGGGPPKGGYKPGHLPEFADPDVKETNTFYDVQSVIAFPNKDENGKPVTSTTPAPTTNAEPSLSKTPSNIGANGNAAAASANPSTAGTAPAKTAMNNTK